jgi:DNA-binding CsgD family transcriptional regulator
VAGDRLAASATPRQTPGVGRIDADSLVADVEELARRGFAREALWGGISARLRPILAHDAACWHTVDPDTLLMTSDAPEVECDALELIADLEYGLHGDTLNRYATLARRAPHVALLSDATGGHLHRSRRYRELLRPFGLEHELRVAFVADGRCWGGGALLRSAGRPDFGEPEVSVLQRLSAAIARGLRRTLAADAARETGDGGPGALVLDASGEVQLMTPPARSLVEELYSAGEPRERLPAPVLAAAARARALGGVPLHVRVESGWISMHPSLPEGTGRGQVALVLERARPPEVAGLVLEAYGLTRREREVAGHVLRGAATAGVAEALFLSPHTVQDHLKSIFEKVDVRSRRELVARLFADQHVPRMRSRARLQSTGAFLG